MAFEQLTTMKCDVSKTAKSEKFTPLSMPELHVCITVDRCG